MPWDENRSALESLLARLFQDERRSRLVAERANLDTSLIEFSSAALINWQAIVDEAVKQGRVQALIDAASDLYPTSDKLRAMASPKQLSGAPPAAPGPSQPSPSAVPSTAAATTASAQPDPTVPQPAEEQSRLQEFINKYGTLFLIALGLPVAIISIISILQVSGWHCLVRCPPDRTATRSTPPPTNSIQTRTAPAVGHFPPTTTHTPVPPATPTLTSIGTPTNTPPSPPPSSTS